MASFRDGPRNPCASPAGSRHSAPSAGVPPDSSGRSLPTGPSAARDAPPAPARPDPPDAGSGCSASDPNGGSPVPPAGPAPCPIPSFLPRFRPRNLGRGWCGLVRQRGCREHASPSRPVPRFSGPGTAEGSASGGRDVPPTGTTADDGVPTRRIDRRPSLRRTGIPSSGGPIGCVRPPDIAPSVRHPIPRRHTRPARWIAGDRTADRQPCPSASRILPA